MPKLDSKNIEEIIHEVVNRLNKDSRTTSINYETSPIFNNVETAVSASKQAQKIWLKVSKERKAKIIDALRVSMHDNADMFSKKALEETGMGRFEDKVIKHHNAAQATPGLEDLETQSWMGDKGMVYEDYAPYGVVAAITPSTHPIPVLFNSLIIIIVPGNSVVFNVHPSAKKVSAEAIRIFNDVIVQNGGPANLVTMIEEPTLESANSLFGHPDVALIAATGGPGLVQSAFSAGKKVIAAGPGNPPVLVDRTADLDLAVQKIIEGASFDNNILCIAEKEVFIEEQAYQQFLSTMEKAGAVKLTQPQIEQLVSKVFIKNDLGNITINRNFIGKNARMLAEAVGVSISDDVRILFGEAEFDCPFVQEEQMMPYLPIVKVRDVNEGILLAVKAEHGYKHTAMIHSNNLENITKFSKAIDTDIVVVNGSSLAGNGGMAGEAYFSHTIASPTGEGICTPRNFGRIRRLSISGTMDII
jgi:acyl-CoA reductase-like NAD-dependent aldehyde dehydrogenase